MEAYLREHIVVEDQWTPIDIERMYYSNRGAIYGVVSDRKKIKGLSFPKRVTYLMAFILSADRSILEEACQW